MSPLTKYFYEEEKFTAKTCDEADQLCLVNPTVAGLMYWGIVSILDHKLPKHCPTQHYNNTMCYIRN